MLCFITLSVGRAKKAKHGPASSGPASKFHVVKDTTHDGAICIARRADLGTHATEATCADAAGSAGCKYFAHSKKKTDGSTNCVCCASQDPVEPSKGWITYKLLLANYSAVAAETIQWLPPVDGKPKQVLFLGDPLVRQGHHFPSLRFLQLQPVLAKRGISLTYTGDPNSLKKSVLDKYDALLVYAMIRRIARWQETALLQYVQDGGGYLGLHSACACFANSTKAVALLGARFKTHAPRLQNLKTTCAEAAHPIMNGGASMFESWEEPFEHQAHNAFNRTVLEYRKREPWSWVRTHGRGRVFYSAWGHDERTWSASGFHGLVERAIHWVSAARSSPASSMEAAPKPTSSEKPGRSLQEQFRDNGYLIVPSVFSDSEIDALRSRVFRYIKGPMPLLRGSGVKSRGRLAGMYSVDLVRDSELRPMVQTVDASARLHETLAHVFGGQAYRYFPRTELSINRYLPFHRDVIYPIPNTPLWKFFEGHDPWDRSKRDGEEQAVLIAVTYLQDHSVDNESLTLLPGTNLPPRDRSLPWNQLYQAAHQPHGPAIQQQQQAASQLPASEPQPVTLHPKKGDVVLLDFRTYHRGRLPLRDPRGWESLSAKQRAAKRELRRTQDLLHHRMALGVAYGRENHFTDMWDQAINMRNELTLNASLCRVRGIQEPRCVAALVEKAIHSGAKRTPPLRPAESDSRRRPPDRI